MTQKATKKSPIKSELNPLPNPPKLSFNDHDRFKRKDFAEKLTKAIQTFSPFYNDAYVLSLNAPYGSGKTTFIEMWRHMLLNEHDISCIYINAWEHDFDDEPLVAILSTLLAHTNNSKALKEAALAAIGSTANDFVSKLTGVNVDKAIQKAAEAGDIQAAGATIYKEYHFKHQAFHKLRESLTKHLETLEQKPLVIFVDELDRARPDYSVKFLETIKHIFPVQGLCFVLAVDREQLQKSVAQLYGDITFEDYYLRFVTNEANLPELNNVDLAPFLDDLEAEFIGEKQKSGVKYPFQEGHKRHIKEFFIKICRGFELKPRQIERLYREFSKFMAVTNEDTSLINRLNAINASIFLIALKMKNSSIYKQLVTDSLSPTDLNTFLRECSFKTNTGKPFVRPILALALSFMMTNSNTMQMEIFDIYDKEDHNYKNEENPHTRKSQIIGMLSRSINDFGEIHDQSEFNYIHNLMESWSSFLE